MVLETLVQLFSQYGLIGLLISSFLLSLFFLPGITEALVPIFLAFGLDPIVVLIIVSIGSSLGGVVNYYVGLFGAKITHKDIKRVEGWLQKWGDLAVFTLAFIPGFPFDFFALAVGFLKMDIRAFIIAMALGKFLKYSLVIYGVETFLKFGSSLGFL